MRDAGLGPMAEPGHVLRLLSIVIASHWIPQVVGSQVLVDGAPDWPGRAAIPRAEHKRPEANGLHCVAHSVEIALPLRRGSDKTPHVPSGDERKGLCACAIGLRRSASPGE